VVALVGQKLRDQTSSIYLRSTFLLPLLFCSFPLQIFFLLCHFLIPPMFNTRTPKHTILLPGNVLSPDTLLPFFYDLPLLPTFPHKPNLYNVVNPENNAFSLATPSSLPNFLRYVLRFTTFLAAGKQSPFPTPHAFFFRKVPRNAFR